MIKMNSKNMVVAILIVAFTLFISNDFLFAAEDAARKLEEDASGIIEFLHSDEGGRQDVEARKRMLRDAQYKFQQASSAFRSAGIGAYGNEEVIRIYVEKQDKQYKQIYSIQLSFLDVFS